MRLLLRGTGDSLGGTLEPGDSTGTSKTDSGRTMVDVLVASAGALNHPSEW